MYEMYIYIHISIRSVDPNFSNSDHIHHHLFFEGDTVSLQLLTFTGKGGTPNTSFNPSEKNISQIGSFPQIGVKIKMVETTT